MENIGYLSIRFGPMFSGKTSYLLNELNNLFYVQNNGVLYINFNGDTRTDDVFSTHNSITGNIGNITGIKINKIEELLNPKILENYNIIGIDEAQFFDDLLINVVKLVQEHKKHVIVVGLDSNFKMEKFGQIIDLIPYCDNVKKLHANCFKCAEKGKKVNASFTKLINKEISPINNIHIGAKNDYMAVCRKHFDN